MGHVHQPPAIQTARYSDIGASLSSYVGVSCYDKRKAGGNPLPKKLGETLREQRQ
jgi:hypothetical protein